MAMPIIILGLGAITVLIMVMAMAGIVHSLDLDLGLWAMVVSILIPIIITTLIFTGIIILIIITTLIMPLVTNARITMDDAGTEMAMSVEAIERRIIIAVETEIIVSDRSEDDNRQLLLVSVAAEAIAMLPAEETTQIR